MSMRDVRFASSGRSSRALPARFDTQAVLRHAIFLEGHEDATESALAGRTHRCQHLDGR
jgi:hypothetical protein